MVKFRPFLLSFGFPNFKLKIKLGALLLCLSLLGNYQPDFAFPPVKSNIVYAEITQDSQITPQDLGVTFQLPHEGYITTKFSAYHPGIDLCAGLGLPVKPIAKGTVVSSGFNFFGLGLVVEVDHGNGYRSLYAHMGKIYVETGTEVNENSFLGEVGLTGNTSGPHTHLEVSKDGAKINPLLILPEIRNYPKEQDFLSAQSSTPSAVAIAPKLKESSGSTNLQPPVTPSPLVQNPAGNPLKTTPHSEELDLKQQNLNNVLNLASPKPSASPLPKGGKISLKNFTLFGLKQ